MWGGCNRQTDKQTESGGVGGKEKERRLRDSYRMLHEICELYPVCVIREGTMTCYLRNGTVYDRLAGVVKANNALSPQ